MNEVIRFLDRYLSYSNYVRLIPLHMLSFRYVEERFPQLLMHCAKVTGLLLSDEPIFKEYLVPFHRPLHPSAAAISALSHQTSPASKTDPYPNQHESASRSKSVVETAPSTPAARAIAHGVNPAAAGTSGAIVSPATFKDAPSSISDSGTEDRRPDSSSPASESSPSLSLSSSAALSPTLRAESAPLMLSPLVLSSFDEHDMGPASSTANGDSGNSEKGGMGSSEANSALDSLEVGVRQDPEESNGRAEGDAGRGSDSPPSQEGNETRETSTTSAVSVITKAGKRGVTMSGVAGIGTEQNGPRGEGALIDVLIWNESAMAKSMSCR